MLVGVADTHAFLWYLYADARLSATAKAFIDTAAMAGDQGGLSSITLIETVYLIAKSRIAAASFTRLALVLEQPRGLFREVAPDLQVTRALARVDVTTVPDMPDRLIAATALHRRVPIISKDGRVRLSGVQTMW